VLRSKNWTTKLLLLDVLLFTAFNPLSFPTVLKLFTSAPLPTTYPRYFWLVIGAVFVAAVIAAWRVRPREKTRRDLAERSAIKGLLPYGEKDAELFARLQREQDLTECVQALTASDFRFGVLCGESGNGKTSFLQAGLRPALPQNNHRCVYVKCTELDPIEAIRQALLEQLVPPDKVIGAPSLPKMLEATARLDTKPLVVILDQFEQFFVHRPRKEEREPFLAALEEWFKRQAALPVKIVVCLRNDFLDRLIELQKQLGYSLGPHQSFRLEKFAPAQAAEIFRVIAEQEKLECDSGFVEKLAADELASATDGMVSPVDIQVLAWMIAGQKLKEERAFNEKTFRKLGGVEGLLERFLTRALDARETEQRRQAAVKVLLALTDLDRNTRAGVLTTAELEEKLQDHLPPDEIADAIEWLARGDVRLIAPVKRKDDSGKEVEGYELAHERLIPALRRIAGKQLGDAARAEQLLDRRTNEWLGSGRHARYQFSWAELRLITKHRQLIAWGKERLAKEALLAASQRRFYWRYAAAGFVTLLIFSGWVGWNSNAWQTWLIKRDLRSYGSSLNDDDALSIIAQAFVYTGDSPQALQVLNRNPDSLSKANALTESYARLGEKEKANALLAEAVKTVNLIRDDDVKAKALRVIAESYAKLGDKEKANALLAEAVKAAGLIPADRSKATTLRMIVESYTKLGDKEKASTSLAEAVKAVGLISDDLEKNTTLRDIAESYAKLSESLKDSALLIEAVKMADLIGSNYHKADALRAIAESHAKLGDKEKASKLLAEAAETAGLIGVDYSKADALSAITESYAKL
jgi:tetratricopeptide (TPR) repeat protein